jgi:hypothetical protein
MTDDNLRKVRRIVTATNEAGRSYILSDTRLPAGELATGEAVRARLWMTDCAPASIEGTDDPVSDGNNLGLAPPGSGGTVISIGEFMPDSMRFAGPERFLKPGFSTTPDRSGRHPGFHRTATLDYAVCLEGEIWALLDEDETLMRAGDVLIQRGTYHSWSNRSDSVCRILFVLIDAS